LNCNNGRGLVDAALKGIGIVQLPDYYVVPFIGRVEAVEKPYFCTIFC
jgi:hypothetical protein